MQSRDPFSGDCDPPPFRQLPVLDERHLAEPRPVLRGLRLRIVGKVSGLFEDNLAEPRPVLRGLRRPPPGILAYWHTGTLLAEPRPVLRGLRRGKEGSGGRKPGDLQSRDPFSGDCDRRSPGGRCGGWPPPCRAETRSQGIATERFQSEPPRPRNILAEPRPVLRGLRPNKSCPPPPIHQAGTLQSRDPFSGDCDRPGRAPARAKGLQELAEPRPVLRGLRLQVVVATNKRILTCLQSRDPFSGDCDGIRGSVVPRTRGSLAEPRPVLRGLRRVWRSRGDRSSPPGACRAETRSQGIATAVSPRACSQNVTISACRAETRSQGIATRGAGADGGRGRGDHACRAETRSQGIATRRARRRRESAPISGLQSRDPFSGDCDGQES